MKLTHFLLLSLPLWGCGKSGNTPPAAPIQPLLSTSQAEYLFDNDTVRQDLLVKWISPHEIEFSFTTVNKLLDCTSRYAGRAVNFSPEAEPDSDQDEQGNSYPVNQYTYEGKGCEISFRIGRTHQNRARIVSGVCENADEQSCSFVSPGVLRRKK